MIATPGFDMQALGGAVVGHLGVSLAISKSSQRIGKCIYDPLGC